ncbi:MAG: class B sortase [Clostridia bacterium]|nr:class B sortase [Clostridia bacterium]
MGNDKSKKKEKGGSGFFWKILFLLALCVFCFSAYQLFTIYKGYKEGVDEYASIEHDTVTKSTETLVPVEQKVTADGQPLRLEDLDFQPPEVDFEELQSINPDVIGWLQLEAIDDISYPIVQGEDNDHYLHRTFKDTYNFAGSIFIDYANSPTFSDCNTIIYGHNMRNGSMFGQLKQMYESEKYKDSKYLWICTPKAKYRYEIFSLQYAAVNSETYTLFSEHDENFGKYLDKMVDKSEVDMETVELSKDDYVVTLSTCTSNDKVRFVVQARWVATY